jgi:MFS family permease
MLQRRFDIAQARRAWEVRGFRWFAWGRLTGAPTGPIRAVVQGWLVYNLTGSALALGWVSAARAVMMILAAPLGGVLSDRFEKRHVMVASRAILTFTSLSLATLLLTGNLQVWHVVVAAALEGISFSILDPALSTVVAELVDREALLSAVSISAVIEALAGAVGAALAGWMIQATGPAGVYLMMAALFITAGYTHARQPRGLRHEGKANPIWSDFLAGLRYLRGSPVLLSLVVLSLARVLLAEPYRTFMPAFAKETLGLDAAGLGLLNSAMGLGWLASSLVATALGNTPHKGKLLLGAGLGGACMVLVLTSVPGLPAPVLWVALEASFTGLGDVLTWTLLQSISEPAYRGRVFSVGMMLSGLVRLGTLPAGAVADRIGVPAVLSALALAVGLIYLLVGLVRRDVRALR